MGTQIDLVQLAKLGWMTKPDPVASGEADFSPDLRNMSPERVGMLKMEKGYERAGEEVRGGSGPYVGLFGATVEDLTSGVAYNVLVYIMDGKLDVHELSIAALDDLAAGNAAYIFTIGGHSALIGSGADSDTYWEHCVYQNKIYVFNKATGYVIWRDTTWQIDELDGDACTDPPPAGGIPKMYLGRMWLGLGRDLYYSEPSPDT